MFSHLFPKGSLGIEITTKYVRFVELKKQSGVFHLKNFGRIKIPHDAFLDDELKKPEYLIAILKKILEESKQKNVRIVLPGDSQQFFYLALPKTSEQEMLSETIFALKENVLFHEGRDTIIDAYTLGDEAHSMTVRAISASASWFKPFKPALALFKNTNLHIERANQAAVVASHKDSSPEPLLHIQFGDDFASLSIVHQNKVQLYQELSFSTHQFLLEVQKRLTKPSAVASGYLSHLGVLGADVYPFACDTIKSLSSAVDHVVLEYGRETGNHIKIVTLGGTFGGYKGVSDLFSKYLRIPVVPAYPWKTFDPRFDESIFDMKKSETLEYLTSLGLAMQGH